MVDGYCFMGPRGRFYPCCYPWDYIGLLGQVNAGFIQALYLGRAPRTKETARFSKSGVG